MSPGGDWQYTKPVALLTNVITGSAADLFACLMRGTGRVITVGTTTHGNLPGFSVLAVLPCGLVARISDAFVTDLNGRIIEANGNEPQIHAEPTVKDVIDGTDSVLDRAVQALRSRGAGTGRVAASKVSAKSSAGPFAMTRRAFATSQPDNRHPRPPRPTSKTVKTPGTTRWSPWSSRLWTPMAGKFTPATTGACPY